MGVATTFGVGLTITVAVIGVPWQLLAVGVIVKFTVTGAFVVFVSVPEILPLPVAAIPVTGPVLSLVHAKVVPVTALDRLIVVIGSPEHADCEIGVAAAFGIGLTVIVNT